MNQDVFNSITKGNFYDRLFAYMKLVGLDSIRLNYSGGGDSGGVDNVESNPDTVSRNIVVSLEEEFNDELSSPIYSRHGSFADGGGYGVDGVLVYDAVEKTVSISGTDHFYDDEYDEEEEEHIESSCRSEEWVEDVYEQVESEKWGTSEEPDFAFAYLYAKDILKGRLPEEFHNRILIAATEHDPSAVKYIKEFAK